jgi:hypothetical protein
VKIWRQDEIAYAGDVVTYDGGTFQALKDTAQIPGGRDWIMLAAAGRDARTPVFCGTFDEKENYAGHDVVMVGGSSFIAKCDDPGTCPGDGWQLYASIGKRGIKGEPGGVGPKGDKGDKGEPAPRFVGWRLDAQNYRAIARMSDGSEHALELRGLFEQFQREIDG